MLRGGIARWCWPPPPIAIVLAFIFAGAPAGAPAVAAAYQASVYANTTAFSSTCIGISDTYPAKLATLATAGYAYLGYSATGYSGSAFTESRFKARIPADVGTYVHSHGDTYSGVQGFREDGGYCSGAPVVHADEVKAARNTTRPAQLVVMSTCHLGERPPSGTVGMSAAFGIPYGAQNLAAYAFYLGYIGSVYDSDQFKFEQALWQRVQAGGASGPIYSLADAFAYARTRMSFIQGSVTWFGNPYYTGWAATSSGCPLCQ